MVALSDRVTSPQAPAESQISASEVNKEGASRAQRRASDCATCDWTTLLWRNVDWAPRGCFSAGPLRDEAVMEGAGDAERQPGKARGGRGC